MILNVNNTTVEITETENPQFIYRGQAITRPGRIKGLYNTPQGIICAWARTQPLPLPIATQKLLLSCIFGSVGAPDTQTTRVQLSTVFNGHNFDDTRSIMNAPDATDDEIQALMTGRPLDAIRTAELQTKFDNYVKSLTQPLNNAA